MAHESCPNEVCDGFKNALGDTGVVLGDLWADLGSLSGLSGGFGDVLGDRWPPKMEPNVVQKSSKNHV